MSELSQGVKNGRIAWRYFQPNRRHVLFFFFFQGKRSCLFLKILPPFSIKIGIWIHNLFLFLRIWLHREANLNSQELSLLVEMVVKRKRRTHVGGGRVVRWCWVNSQYWGVLQFGLQ